MTPGHLPIHTRVRIMTRRRRIRELEAEMRAVRSHLGGLYGDLEVSEAVRIMLADARGIRDQRIAERDARIEHLEERITAVRKVVRG